MASSAGPVFTLQGKITAGALLAGVLLALWMESFSPKPGPSAGPVPGPGPETYERVVCLSPALVEIVFDIGAGRRVAGVPDFLFGPPAARTLPRVGGAFNPNLERILSLQPDFLLFQGKSSKVRAFALRHGIPFPDPPLELDTLEDLFRAYWRLGLLFRIPEKAEEAAHRLRSSLARTAAKGFSAGPPVPVFLALGHREGTLAGIYTATGKTFLGEIARVAGGAGVFASAPGTWPQVSLESVQAREPEVILDFHPGEKVREKALLEDWKKALPGLPAVREKRVYILTQKFLLVPGPRAAETAEVLFRLLHPADRKKKGEGKEGPGKNKERSRGSRR